MLDFISPHEAKQISEPVNMKNVEAFISTMNKALKRGDDTINDGLNKNCPRINDKEFEVLKMTTQIFSP